MLSLRDEGSNVLCRTFDVEQGSAKFFYGNVPHPLLWDDSQETREKIIVSDIPKSLCGFYSVYTVYKCGRGSLSERLGKGSPYNRPLRPRG